MKKNCACLLLTLTILLSKPITTKAQVDINDSLALVDLYNSTDGPHWVDKYRWLTKAPLPTWFGIFVKAGRVNTIALSRNNLSGNVPESLAKFTNLEVMSLAENKVSHRPTPYFKKSLKQPPLPDEK